MSQKAEKEMVREAEIKKDRRSKEGRKAETAETRKCWPLFCVRWAVRSEKWRDHKNPVYSFHPLWKSVWSSHHNKHSTVHESHFSTFPSVYPLKLLNLQKRLRDNSCIASCVLYFFGLLTHCVYHKKKNQTIKLRRNVDGEQIFLIMLKFVFSIKYYK